MPRSRAVQVDYAILKDKDRAAAAAAKQKASTKRMGYRAQAIIDARRAASVVPKGIAGIAASSVLCSSALLGVINQYLRFPDLYEFRQCSHATAKAVTTYVRAPHNGMADRLWEMMNRHEAHSLVVAPLRKFQAGVAAAGTTITYSMPHTSS
jgi:multisubunit Na+/H+ antiporter MnhG subunit